MTKVSVLIPAYNCTSTLAATVDSVLAQTRPADEVLIMDDGSTDATRALAQSYEPRVKVYWQPNEGVARARNALIALATGDLIAFVDCDDIWHSQYIEVQLRRFEEYPDAVAFFAGHVNFFDGQKHEWPGNPESCSDPVELIGPVEFFKRYNKRTGPFGSASFLTVPRNCLQALGDEPFQQPGVDDSYLCSLLSLLGSVVYTPAPLVAYRIRATSLSANHVKTFGSWVRVFELLEGRFMDDGTKEMRLEFRKAFAAKRRAFAKLLMGGGSTGSARAQLCYAMRDCLDPISLTKTAVVLAITFLPRQLQPPWPASFRPSPQLNVTKSARRGTAST